METMIMQECLIEKNAKISETKAMIEGMLPLPDCMEDMMNLLDIAGLAEITKIEMGEGRIAIEGKAAFSILYQDQKGEMACFDSECEFRHQADAPGATPGMVGLGEAKIGEIFPGMKDGRNLQIRAEVCLHLWAMENQTMEILDGAPKEGNAQVLQKKATLPYLQCARQLKSYLQSELRVPQNMPPVQKILITRGHALLTNVQKEEEKLILEGELQLEMVYFSTDKNAPLQCYRDVIPFGEIVSDVCCDAAADVFASSRLIRLSVAAGGENSDILECTAAIQLLFLCYGKKETVYLEDMYSPDGEWALQKTEICMHHFGERQSVKRILRLPVQLPETEPEVARALYAAGNVEITGAWAAGDRIRLQGILQATFCCTTQESGMKSMKQILPFETEIAVETLPKGAEIDAQAFAESVQINGSGRELEAKCTLDILWNLEEHASIFPLCKAEYAPRQQRLAPGIAVYFTCREERLWDVAKRYGVRREDIRALNGNLKESVPKGTKLLIIR